MDWKSLGIGVLGSIIAAVFIYLLAKSRGWIEFSFSRWRHDRSVFQRLKVSGLSNFYASRSDFARYRNAPNLIDYLRTAKHSVVVAGYWLAQGNEAEGIASEIGDLVRRPYERTVTIAIIDPTGPCIPELASYLGIPQDELVRRIESSLLNLYRIRPRLSPDEQHRLTIKAYRTIPIASVIILDGDLPEGRIQLDIKPYRVPRHYSFSFELSGPGSGLYDLCFKAWGSLVSDAPDFDPEHHLVNRQPGVAAEETRPAQA